MAAFASIIVLFVLSSSALCNASFFKLQNCAKHSIAEVTELTVKPDPVIMKKKMNVTLVARLNQDVPKDAILKVKFYKVTRVLGVSVDIPIPCLLGKFGSCTRKFCDSLAGFLDQACPFFPGNPGKSCGCPVKAGDYVGKNLAIELPDMGAIARFVARGKYRTELRLFDGKKELACYKMFAELK